MSPAAAVDIRSPVTSKHPSSLQNPNPNLMPNNNRETVNAPVFGSQSEINMNKKGSQTGLGRARPRLVKVRRQLHGRSRGAGPGQLRSGSGSGFNPFKSVSDDCCSSDTNLNRNSSVSSEGFVFGANGSVKGGDLDFDLNSRLEFDCKETEFVGNVGQLRHKEPTLDSKVEDVEFGDVGFVFGANGNNVGVKFDLERRKSNESGVNVGEVESQKVSNEGDCEFSDDRSELGLNLNSNEGNSSGDGMRLGSDDVGFVFGAAHEGSSTNAGGAAHEGSSTNAGVSGSDFVFVASWFDGTDEEERESGESTGVSVFPDTGKIKVKNEAELHKVKAKSKGVFVFGSSSKKSSNLNEYVDKNFPAEVKPTGKTVLNCSISKDQNGNLDSSVNDKCKFATFANSSNVASASSMNLIYNLPEKIKKLNINEFNNVHGADSKNSSADDDTSFVFRSSKKASAFSDSSSDTCSPEQNAAMGSDGDKFESSDKNKSCHTESASIGISSSASFTFQAGCAKSSFEGQLSQDQVNGDTQVNENGPLTSSSSIGFDSHVNDGVSEATAMAGVGKENNKSSSTGTLCGLGMPFTDFKTPWDPCCLKTSLFPESNKKPEFSANSGSKKGKRSEMRIKLKQDSLRKQQPELDHVQNERSGQENLNSPGCYSPMDFSPYEEMPAAEKFSDETSVIANDSNHQETNCAPSILHSNVITGLKESEGLDVDKDDGKNPRENMNQESFGSGSERRFMSDYISKGFVFGADMACSGFDFEQVGSSNAGAASTEATYGLKTETCHRVQFSFASGLEDIDGRKFSFSASSSEQVSSSTPRHRYIKKYRRKPPCKPFVVAPNPNGQEENLSTPQRNVGNKSEINELVKQGPISSAGSVQEACEMWRARWLLHEIYQWQNSSHVV